MFVIGKFISFIVQQKGLQSKTFHFAYLTGINRIHYCLYNVHKYLDHFFYFILELIESSFLS